MSEAPSLIVGLGNPGREYAATRHNVGFMTIDELCRRGGAVALRSKFSGQFGKIALRRYEPMVLKPETYMNDSGRSVQAAAAFFQVAPGDLIVLHDELDLPFGEVRVKVGGGHAGHNGLRSIVQCLGVADFVRVRIGIGRPPAGFTGEIADYVLSGFTGAERAELDAVIAKAASAVERIVYVGLARAMNEVNARPKPPRAPKSNGNASESGSTVSPSGNATKRGSTEASSAETSTGGPEVAPSRADEPSAKPSKMEKTSVTPSAVTENRTRLAWC